MSTMNWMSNWQQTSNRYKYSINGQEFGDKLNKKSNEVIRYTFQNIRGFGTNKLAIKQFIDQHEVDIFGMAEVNQN